MPQTSDCEIGRKNEYFWKNFFDSEPGPDGEQTHNFEGPRTISSIVDTPVTKWAVLGKKEKNIDKISNFAKFSLTTLFYQKHPKTTPKRLF